MTTIFASVAEGVMVCDSKTTSGGQWFSSTKVQRVGDELVAFAGYKVEGLKWLDWYSNGKRGPQPKIANSEALILNDIGLFYLDPGGELTPIERGFMGVGTGGPCAVAAHMTGCDAETAVYIACAIDANSGGDVIVHKLAP